MRLPLYKGCHLIVIVPDSMTLVVEYQFRVYKIEIISCLKVRVTLTGTWTLHWTVGLTWTKNHFC